MKKDSKQRLLEVMGKLDKTFKPKLNEEFEVSNDTTPLTAPEIGSEVPEEENLSVEEKLKKKVEELYALIHGEESKEETSDEEMNERKKWNFEKKKGEKDLDKNFDEENKESKKHEKSETPSEEKKEHDLDENKGKKVPVAAIAKVGK